MKLGSLFDGSGGFPLAGSLCGIEPVWAAEVEPYPIAVTHSRFPSMRHLGDISKVNGSKLEPVDIITFGSPCQDLSVAGKQAGIKHTDSGDDETTRSGLFMEAVRIIKEMREATHGLYPRFALWENVPGAFSSNSGEDFRTVLEELIRIPLPGAVMPPVPRGGWAYADSYIGDGWSLAYRVFDAQYWGVPQRRRRIHLVLDLRGECAREVLFEREGLRGYFAPSGAQGQGAAPDAEGSPGADDRPGAGAGADGGLDAVVIVDNFGGQAEYATESSVAPTLKSSHYKGAPCVTVPAAGFCTEHSANSRGVGFQEEVSPTLRAGVTPACVYSVENHPNDSRVSLDESGKVQTLTSRMGTGGGNAPMVLEGQPVYCLQGNGIDRADTAGCNGRGVREDVCYTLNTIDRPAVAYGIGNGQVNQSFSEELVGALNCMHDQQAVAYAGPVVFDKEVYQSGVNSTGGHYISEGGPAPTLRTTGHPSGVAVRYIVRRLTPTECARLQGFADCWGHIEKKESFTDAEWCFWSNVRNTHAAINGRAVKSYTKAQMLSWYNKLHTDSAEYKMWGNGIALPPALYCMQGITDVLLRGEDDSWML